GKGVLHYRKKARVAEEVAEEAPAAVGVHSPDDDSEATVDGSPSNADAPEDPDWDALEEEDTEEAPQAVTRPGREVGFTSLPLLFIFSSSPLFLVLLQTRRPYKWTSRHPDGKPHSRQFKKC